MADIAFNAELKKDYDTLWATMKLSSDAPVSTIKTVVNKLLANRSRYWEMTKLTGVPWPLIACIHSLEAGGDFNKHLHNGDSLAKRTWRVPANRPKAEPKAGNGKPYTWEESAYDALVNVKGLHKIKNWTVARMLFVLEGYNGYGYRLYHPKVKSPYLWSFTNHYKVGKYESDGVYNPKLVSKQVGCAILLKQLVEFADRQVKAGKQ